MRIRSFGKNYDVMDEKQQVLCQAGLDASPDVTGSLVGRAVGAVAGGFLGKLVARNMQCTYTV